MDFHQSALKWLKQNDFIKPERLSLEHCFFNETKEAKLEKIKALKCDFFIDDLSRILDHPLFPVECHGILFSPHDLAEQKETVLTSWLNFQDIFYDK
ncbi:MAG: hypothetical protein GY908_04045 [Flavobacteriales bacterium]|nr:hypothetical protein [Flavobacteriales bacterium]